ncbi:small integral membrane protein 19, partial [Mustelus asterias]
NKRKIMRIFTLPPAADLTPEPNFYDNLQKVRLRQQLEMYYSGKYDSIRSKKESVKVARKRSKPEDWELFRT